MKNIAFTIILINLFSANAQIGIGTDTPHSSSILDINPSSNDKGLLIPRLTRSQRDAITSPASGLLIFQTDNAEGLYYYSTSTSSWSKMSLSSEINEYGDIKTGIQSSDHNGWVKLDGRSISILSASQQAVATSLGISTNLPNADDAFLVQNGENLGEVSGSNEKTISQTNLPNVNFSVTVDTAGDHSHSGTTNTTGNHVHNMTFQRNQQDHGITGKIGDNGEFGDYIYSGSMQAAGNHAHTVSTNLAGNHAHTVTVNSGGSGLAVDITPKSLSVNTFLFLGN